MSDKHVKFSVIAAIALVVVLGAILLIPSSGVALAGKDLPGDIGAFGVDVYAVAGTGLSSQGVSSPYVTVVSWSYNPVTYSLENCPPSLDCGVAFNVLRQAVEAWDNVSGITLNEVSAGAGDIRITFGDDEMDWGGRRLDGPGNILGYSYFPYDFLGDQAGDIFLDPDENWVVGNPNSQQIDLLSVAMHEMGHSLGLDHTSDSSALMWAEYDGVRGLGPDDIAGIQSLYGPPAAGEPGYTPPQPAPAPMGGAPADTGVTATSLATLRIRSGPGTEYNIVGVLNYRAVVPVLGRNAESTWAFIDYSGVRGWVSVGYLRITGSLSGVPIVGLDQPTGGTPIDTGVTATSTVNLRVRSGPGTGYAVISTFSYGMTLPVVGRTADNAWLQIAINGSTGWVAGWYCTVAGDVNILPVTG